MENKMPEMPKTEPVKPSVVLPEKLIKDVPPPVMKLQDCNPSNYLITPEGKGKIKAVSTLTNEVFVGTMKEFNERIK